MRDPYPWPVSALSEDDMALLHAAREASTPRVPITKLIHKAVIASYGENRSLKLIGARCSALEKAA